MLKPGHTSPELIDTLFELLPKPNTAQQGPRLAVREYLVNGGSQKQYEAQFNVPQPSISRLLKELNRVYGLALSIAQIAGTAADKQTPPQERSE